MVRFKGFIGPTYSLRSVNVECQRTINLYPEINELRTGADGEIGALLGTPGTRLLCTVGNGPIRGAWVVSESGALVVVSGNQVFWVDSSWVATLLGVLGSRSGPVGMADNGVQVCIVDGLYGYIVTVADWTLTPIQAEGFPGGTNVVFQDGYFIVNKPGSGQWAISALYDGLSWDAADFATAEGSPDPLVTLLSDRRQVWLFGQRTIEVWYNSGAQDFPFSRLDGAYIEYGCAAPFTAQKFANTVLWLGAGANGNGIVWMAQGYQPQRISNHAVEIAIQACGDLSAAVAWVYQTNGHMFYVLILPNSSTSWVYDISTGQWHERAYLGDDGAFQRHRGQCYAWAYQTDVVGDYQNGNLYALDYLTRTDNGRPLKWLRRSPHISQDMQRMAHHRLQIDAQMGVGLDGSGNGIDPKIAMRYSDDFGTTWTAERSRTLGKIGQYRNRAYWDRLGQSRTRVYEISGSDPVPVVLLGAEIEVS